MPDPTSVAARIIPFPLWRTRPARDAGQDRLRRALEGLEDALAEQRDAVARWRGALGELTAVVASLGDNLGRYRENLDTLTTRVGGLHAQAMRLERTADAVLAIASPE